MKIKLKNVLLFIAKIPGYLIILLALILMSPIYILTQFPNYLEWCFGKPDKKEASDAPECPIIKF